MTRLETFEDIGTDVSFQEDKPMPATEWRLHFLVESDGRGRLYGPRAEELRDLGMDPSEAWRAICAENGLAERVGRCDRCGRGL